MLSNLCCVFRIKINKNVLFNKIKNTCVRFFNCLRTILCATFHCNWTNGFKVLCTLVSTIKSKMATISKETNHGFYFIFFSRIVHSDLIMKYAIMTILGLKMSKKISD